MDFGNWLGIAEAISRVAPLIGALATALATIVLAVLIARLRRVFVTRVEHAGVREVVTALQNTLTEAHARLDAGDARFQRLEQQIGDLPTRHEMARLADAVGRQAESLAAISETLKGQAGALEWLRENVFALTSHELAEARAVKTRPGGRDV
ncbi:hypothetical protein [Roseospirillum parvum]|uniref:Uncharacterized protein n=1 Tax=Roseospirillum parvum TaxID=83401 RepID=A0A1G8EYJ6_9PROT|nr:hypothetical protein [Roseospirillum parvum]SDH74912.1 hypothetical protein SAMN05421742_11180 [Roseospirillum parvum]